MKYSVLMTVHDREPEVLLACLRGLRRSGLQDAEIVIVDDRSTTDAKGLVQSVQSQFATVKFIETGDYDGYRIKGYGNPAYAFNRGLEVVAGETVLLMSSDVIVTPPAVKSMKRYHNQECIFTPKVYDMDKMSEYCGPGRVFPMPWFTAAPTQACIDVGGWDEQYMGGLCWEDNDFIGRVALKLGLMRADWDSFVFHQSHYQPAYDWEDPEVKEANNRNRDYTKQKWGGLPFDGEFTPFNVSRRPDPSGIQQYVFAGNDISGLIEKTQGIRRASV